MVWAAIGSTVASGVLGTVLNKKKSATQQVANTPGAAISDPFASQRQQYQPQMQNLMAGDPSHAQQFIDYSGGSKSIQTTGGAGQPFNPDASLYNPTDMRVDPASVFNDPSYNFRVSQGEAALDRAHARGGMLGSGNQMAELMTYGQNMATQEYDKIFQRNMGVHQQEQGDFNSMFQRGLQVHGQQESDYNNEFNRLALLSGANSGSPASAGQLVSQQAAQNQNSTNALTGKVVDAAGNLITKGLKSWLDTPAVATPYIAQETPNNPVMQNPTPFDPTSQGIPRTWFNNTIG